jgi:hypothetical protein
LASVEFLPGDSPSWRLSPKHAPDYKSFSIAWREQGLGPSALAEVSELPPTFNGEVNNGMRTSNMARDTVRGHLQLNANDAILTPGKNQTVYKPVSDGYVALSLAGDLTVQRRREEAKDRIADGSGLAQLKYLIEGVPLPHLLDRGFKHFHEWRVMRSMVRPIRVKSKRST